MIKAILTDAAGNVVKEIMWPHDPRLRSNPNTIQAEAHAEFASHFQEHGKPPKEAEERVTRSDYVFSGEVREDGALIYREST